MSYWTHITGTVTVCPMGRTQAEKRYVLETVLNHLPIVGGSERDMTVHIVQKAGYNCSCSGDEFGMRTNNLKDSYGNHSYKQGWLKTQDEYILVVEGAFRDRMLKETYREFINWLCRLAKRIHVLNVLVNIDSDDKGNRVICETDKFDNMFANMFEDPSWMNENSLNWCEFMLWERDKYSFMPLMLAHKYFDDKVIDEEIERRQKFMSEE